MYHLLAHFKQSNLKIKCEIKCENNIKYTASAPEVKKCSFSRVLNAKFDHNLSSVYLDFLLFHQQGSSVTRNNSEIEET